MLADALALADSDAPDSIFVFATLTGAARTALGPDLPAFFTDDEGLAQSLPPARGVDRRSPMAPAALGRLPSPPRQRHCRHQQRLGIALCRRHHRGVISETVCQQGPPFRPFRSLWLAAGGTAARTQGRRASDRAGGDGAVEAGAVVVTAEVSQRLAGTLDPRRNAFRAGSRCKEPRRCRRGRPLCRRRAGLRRAIGGSAAQDA